MKRLTAIAAVFALGLIAPTTVGAAAKEYNGTFESSGTVDFKLKKSNKGKKKIIDFAFHGFPVHCDGGPNSTSGILKFKVKVEKNKFEADAQSTDPGSESRLTLTGKLKGGGQAEGTLKVHGKNVSIDDPPGQRDDCTSPKTDWIASVDV